MKKYVLDLTVSHVERLNNRYVQIRLTHSEPLPPMLPGQFVEVRIDDEPNTMLRRPISINNVDVAANELWLLVATIGNGTRRLGRLSAGDKLNCVLPLGRGFSMPTTPGHRLLLVGGGVGVAPLLFFGSQLRAKGYSPTFLLGARSEGDLLQIERFRQIGEVCITTEDGSMGEKGFVTNHTVLQQRTFDSIATNLRTKANDDGCGALCHECRRAMRGFAREHDGLRTGCLPVLCRKDSRGQPLRMQGRARVRRAPSAVGIVPGSQNSDLKQ